MKKVLLLALLVLASASAEAQDYLYGLPMYRGPVSAMGTCEAAKPRLWVTTDSTAAGNCAAGSGSAQVLCLCSGGTWAAVGTGTGGTDVTNLVGATTGGWGSNLLFACEFNSDNCSAAVNYGSVTLNSGTVTPMGSAPSSKITVDYATWPGWMMLQQNYSSFQCVTWEWPIPTSDTTYTVVLRAAMMVHGAAGGDQLENNEGTLGFELFNSADSNELVTNWPCESDGESTGCDNQMGLRNDGSLTYFQENSPRFGFGGEALYVIWRNGDNYLTGVVGLSGSYILGGGATKTGVTTFDRIRLFECASNNYYAPIHAVDYIRIYDSIRMPPRVEATDTGP